MCFFCTFCVFFSVQKRKTWKKNRENTAKLRGPLVLAMGLVVLMVLPPAARVDIGRPSLDQRKNERTWLWVKSLVPWWPPGKCLKKTKGGNQPKKGTWIRFWPTATWKDPDGHRTKRIFARPHQTSSIPSVDEESSSRTSVNADEQNDLVGPLPLLCTLSWQFKFWNGPGFAAAKSLEKWKNQLEKGVLVRPKV